MKAKVIRIYEDFVRELGLEIKIKKNPEGSFFNFSTCHIEMPIKGDCFPEECKLIFKQHILDVPINVNFYLLTLLHEIGHYISLRDEIISIEELEEDAEIAFSMMGKVLSEEAEMIAFMKEYYLSIRAERLANIYAKAIVKSKPNLVKKYSQLLNPLIQ